MRDSVGSTENLNRSNGTFDLFIRLETSDCNGLKKNAKSKD